jgi:hypothetical protein
VPAPQCCSVDSILIHVLRARQAVLLARIAVFASLLTPCV